MFLQKLMQICSVAAVLLFSMDLSSYGSEFSMIDAKEACKGLLESNSIPRGVVSASEYRGVWMRLRPFLKAELASSAVGRYEDDVLARTVLRIRFVGFLRGQTDPKEFVRTASIGMISYGKKRAKYWSFVVRASSAEMVEELKKEFNHQSNHFERFQAPGTRGLILLDQPVGPILAQSEFLPSSEGSHIFVALVRNEDPTIAFFLEFLAKDLSATVLRPTATDNP